MSPLNRRYLLANFASVPCSRAAAAILLEFAKLAGSDICRSSSSEQRRERRLPFATIVRRASGPWRQAKSSPSRVPS